MARVTSAATAALALVALAGCAGSVTRVPDDQVEVVSRTDPWAHARATKPATPPPAPAALLVAPAPPGPRPKVAVMSIEDRSEKIDQKLLDDLTEYLRARLTATGSYMVIDQTRQAEHLKKLVKLKKKESYQACYDRECQIPLGQALAADSILRASIARIGGVYTLSLELVDLAREATVGGAVAECEADPEEGRARRLLGALREAVEQL